MKWVICPVEDDGKTIYGRVDDDGLMRITCVAEHPELQNWLEESGLSLEDLSGEL